MHYQLPQFTIPLLQRRQKNIQPPNRPLSPLWFLISFGLLITIIVFTSPDIVWNKLLLFVILGLSLFTCSWWLLYKKKKAVVISFVGTAFFLLRYFGLRHWIYPLLLLSLTIALFMYIDQRDSR